MYERSKLYTVQVVESRGGKQMRCGKQIYEGPMDPGFLCRRVVGIERLAHKYLPSEYLQSLLKKDKSILNLSHGSSSPAQSATKPSNIEGKKN